MSTTAEITPRTPAIGTGRTVVAVVLQWRGKIALLRRSGDVHHDADRWHCVTAYVEQGSTPAEQARLEIYEETGLTGEDLIVLQIGRVLTLTDDSGALWAVHTFTGVTSQRRLKLDWEHNAYRWTAPGKAARFTNRVSWLDPVLQATGHLPV